MEIYNIITQRNELWDDNLDYINKYRYSGRKFKEDGNERYIRCHGRCQGGMWYSLSLWRYD